MSIHVEFFGIPRARAASPSLDVEGNTLGEVLDQIARQMPAWAADCLDGRRLRAGLIANVNGQKFITDPDTVLAGGDSLLILSADVGG